MDAVLIEEVNSDSILDLRGQVGEAADVSAANEDVRDCFLSSDFQEGVLNVSTVRHFVKLVHLELDVS